MQVVTSKKSHPSIGGAAGAKPYQLSKVSILLIVQSAVVSFIHMLVVIIGSVGNVYRFNSNLVLKCYMQPNQMEPMPIESEGINFDVAAVSHCMLKPSQK